MDNLLKHWEIVALLLSLAAGYVFMSGIASDQAAINDALMDDIELGRRERSSILLTVEEVRTAQGEIIGRLSADSSMPYQQGYDAGYLACSVGK